MNNFIEHPSVREATKKEMAELEKQSMKRRLHHLFSCYLETPKRIRRRMKHEFKLTDKQYDSLLKVEFNLTDKQYSKWKDRNEC